MTSSLFTMVFDVDVRYSGASVGSTISQILGTAFAPTIAPPLYAASGTSKSILIYMPAISAISLVSVLMLRGGKRVEVPKQAEPLAVGL